MVTLVLGGEARALTLHVDAGASGGNGSAAAPFHSIAVATDRARAGDVVQVRRGVYSGQVVIRTSGNRGAPIIVRGEPGAVIDGRGVPSDASLVDISGSNIVFEGFQVQNAPRTGIALWGTQNVTVRSNVVVGSQGAGIWVGHDLRGVSGRNIVENNVVLKNCLMNVRRGRDSGWPIGIAVSLSDGSIVRGNRVYENHGEGIGVLSSNGVEVSRNVVYDNFSVNIYLDNAPRTSVQANLVGSTGNRTFFRHGRAPDGVLIANEATRYPMQSREIAVTGNTLLGVRDVYYGNYGLNTGLHTSTISPNHVEPGRWLVPPTGAGT